MALIWGKSRRLWGSPAPLYRHGMRRLLCEFSIFPLKKKKDVFLMGHVSIHSFSMCFYCGLIHPFQRRSPSTYSVPPLAWCRRCRDAL